jgi:hypothetical protein
LRVGKAETRKKLRANDVTVVSRTDKGFRDAFTFPFRINLATSLPSRELGEQPGVGGVLKHFNSGVMIRIVKS